MFYYVYDQYGYLYWTVNQMLQKGNKCLIIPLVYLLPMPFGGKKHYIVINVIIVLLLL